MSLPSRELNALIQLFALAEALVGKELLRALARGTAPSTAAERGRRLADITAILTSLRSAAVGVEGNGAAWDVIESSYRQGLKNAGGDVDTFLGGIHLRAARELYDALTDSLDDAIAYVGRRSRDVFRKATLNEVLVGQIAGRSRTETGKAIEENLRSRGIDAFQDSRGRGWSLPRYARMAALTTATEANTTATLNRLAENGLDLVTWHVGAGEKTCEVCRPYDGKVYSISGTSEEHPALREAPPVHPNCRCVLTASVEALNTV